MVSKQGTIRLINYIDSHGGLGKSFIENYETISALAEDADPRLVTCLMDMNFYSTVRYDMGKLNAAIDRYWTYVEDCEFEHVG